MENQLYMMVKFRVGILSIKKTNKKNLYSNKDTENLSMNLFS